MGDFVKIKTHEKTLISSDTLKNIAGQLPEKRFVRIHKSYIISIGAFNYLEGNRVKVGDEFLPVGLTYKENLLAVLDVRNDD